MRKILLFIFCIHSIYAQMTTSCNVTALDLVQNSMVGYGIEIVDVMSQGDSACFGPFTGTGSTIGFDDGLILTTGTIMWGQGPIGMNNVGNAGIENNIPGYFLLNNTSSPAITTFNATVFEIQFIPTGDSIFFTYVFGSEEYKEYVGTSTSDRFAAFLSGPLPGGGSYMNQMITFVSVETINHLTNSSMYVDNELPSPGMYTQYDGYTIPLIARAAVIPGANYMLSIAVADVADGLYDSGVFIKAHSFVSGEYIGIEEEKPFDNILVYPLPAKENINIEAKNNLLIHSITLTEYSGKHIMTQDVYATSTNINVNSLSSGIYFLKLYTSEGCLIKKIIVQ